MTSETSTGHFGWVPASTIVSLSLTILAYKRALEPLYASVPTHNYINHAILAASALGSLFSVSVEKAVAIYSTLLVIAPHTSYWAALYSARWRDPVLGPVFTHAVVLVPLISAGVLLLHSCQPSQSTGSRFLRLPFYCFVFPSLEPIWDLIPPLSFFSSADIFIALTATILLTVLAMDLKTNLSPHTKKSAKKPTKAKKSRFLPRLSLCAVLAGVSFYYTPTLHSRFRGTISDSYIDQTKTVKILSSTQSNTGVIVVGEVLAASAESKKAHPTSFRYLRAAHSLLGGAWVNDHVVMKDASFQIFDSHGTQLGDSVYAAFVVQEAVRLVNSTDRGDDWTGSDALIIGLGAGVAPTSLRRHGISTTIVEIDPAVYSAARTFFGLPDPGEGKIFLEDARGWVAKRREAIHNEQEKQFDIVIHDCFSGGGVPAHIFTLEFWSELRDVLRPDGVVAVNLAGNLGSRTTRAVLSTLLAAFAQCRAFCDSYEARSEDQLKNEFLNMVFFCTSSTTPMTFRPSRKEDHLGSYLREHILGSLNKGEIDLGVILGNGGTDLNNEPAVLTDESNPLGKWQEEEAAQHWKLMRDIFQDVFWEIF